MSLTTGQKARYANVPNGGVGILTGTSIGTLGSNTNGVAIYTAGSEGGRVLSLTGVTDDTVTVNVLLYIYRGTTPIPLGLVNIPLSSGNTQAAKYNVDFLDGVNIVGLPVDNQNKRYIPLMPNDVLKCTSLANLSGGKSCWVQGQGYDYQP